jgi:hypothetical protein
MNNDKQGPGRLACDLLAIGEWPGSARRPWQERRGQTP